MTQIIYYDLEKTLNCISGVRLGNQKVQQVLGPIFLMCIFVVQHVDELS